MRIFLIFQPILFQNYQMMAKLDVEAEKNLFLRSTNQTTNRYLVGVAECREELCGANDDDELAGVEGCTSSAGITNN